MNIKRKESFGFSRASKELLEKMWSDKYPHGECDSRVI